MAPRKMKQVALKSKMVKNMKVRFKFKRMKEKMAKIRDDLENKGEEQRIISERYEEIKRQFDQLKEKIEMIKKIDFMVDLRCKILIAEEDGDFIEAAALTNFLDEIAAKEIANASLDDEEKDDEDPQ
ncbi:hypothetical protein DITRI_Ditri13aG0109700 [Diplodiscus trichospermus]